MSAYGACRPRCGWLVTYLSNGIPHASDSLNDTRAGRCFAATSMPLIAVNQTSWLTTRIYIPTAELRDDDHHHQPQKQQQQQQQHSEDGGGGGGGGGGSGAHAALEPAAAVRCRLVAEDVADAMNNRLQQAWTYDYYCHPPPHTGSAATPRSA